MEREDSEIAESMKRLVERGVPFAAVLLPGEEAYHFYGGELTGDSRLVIREFNGGRTVELGEVDSLESLGREPLPSQNLNVNPLESTDKEDYCEGAERIIADLKRRGGKTVYSKVTVRRSAAHPVDVMLRYHASHPHTFRYLFYSKDYGLWFGATPEPVLKADLKRKIASSIALAGTRKRGENGDWDKKNSEEHNFVVRHIVGVFEKANLEVTISDAETLRFGDIEHLMHRIEGKGDFDATKLLDALAPTPAICGAEKADALEHIEKYEKHRRGFYGGEVGIVSDERVIFYANLRCARAVKSESGDWEYALITGGGLTADSNVEDEWEETGLKAASLLEVIKNVEEKN